MKELVLIGRKLGEPQGRPGKVRKISLAQRFDPRTVQPVIIINILPAIGLALGGSSPVHIYREHYLEYTNNAHNTYVHSITK